MSARPVRSLITVLMNIFVVLAVVLTAKVVVVFFGALATQAWAEALVSITDLVTVPWGIDSLKTPYGGVFDVNAAVTIAAVLLVEWLLSLARNRA